MTNTTQDSVVPCRPDRIKEGDTLTPRKLWNATTKKGKLPEACLVKKVQRNGNRSQTGFYVTVDTVEGNEVTIDADWFLECLHAKRG
jgi:hypothetical protein